MMSSDLSVYEGTREEKPADDVTRQRPSWTVAVGGRCAAQL